MKTLKDYKINEQAQTISEIVGKDVELGFAKQEKREI